MKTAICYYSRHHGNTRKVLEAMAGEGGAELIDVTVRRAVRLEEYDCIGFASGIYYGTFQEGVLRFARQYLQEGKDVFFVCTYGVYRRGYSSAIGQIARERGCRVLGTFGCRGFDTFGPFRLVGGIAKGRPNERDLDKARSFFRQIQNRLS
ncbi:flavodoxin family protein [Dysosmobacter sp. Marseille-Q4140]|nr:flavodoxin family protein [Dysosmobacter sp. Marseille-Q4140]